MADFTGFITVEVLQPHRLVMSDQEKSILVVRRFERKLRQRYSTCKIVVPPNNFYNREGVHYTLKTRGSARASCT
ncbi:hypothetical protein O9K51_10565 [Purpureocillium lavendulum]|uniref:Uncharacterized protein n=1 Tax=Purpureocillium lavendulum TaxID=1247861 RepID=A0AB34FBM8_9HYPO|nr:hypothetical protein O9K51_10565 [Purpureocillium lavendulum]